MKDLDYYKMRACFYDKEVEKTVSFKFKELEQIWFYNRKNIQNKIKKYEKEGKYSYFPGRGRGNASRIIYKHSFKQEIENAVLDCIKHNNLEDIIKLLQLPIPKMWISKASKEMKTLFGTQSTSESKEVLRTVIKKKMSTLDPLLSSINQEAYFIQQLGSTLVTFNKETNSVQPHIAHHWKVNDDCTSWTFYLRKSVHFHHERILTSEDVKHTLQRFISESSPHRWLVADIESIECVSPYIVTIHLNQSNRFFIRYMGSYNFSILPKDEPLVENKWIGTGPFQLKKHTDSMIVLEAFDHYFLERPILDEIEFYFVPDEMEEQMTIQIRGEEKGEGKVQKQDVTAAFRFLAFNFRRASIIQNDYFRKAIYHLLNMNKMWGNLGRDNLIESSSYFPWKSNPQKKDKSLVKELIAKSGYQGELLTIYTKDSTNSREEAEWFVEEARSVGIHLRCELFNMENFYSTKIDEEADLIFMNEVSSTDMHISFLHTFYNEALIFRRFIDDIHIKYIDNCLESFKREIDPTIREGWIDEIEKYLREEFLIIYMYHPISSRSFSQTIQDTKFDEFGMDDFRKTWIE
ncbi:ABC transporter substrate-binding protein [Bacillus solimangrovi]|uniref:ABC transporter substrate-binding protein n=1 Tax=Bacillus solimangrovi TaxID=1305675 RepID=A0A1E5LAG3_9BACI|nr:ABC transporter substrate-binding protein [Bacillus solimangrovi]OEH91088.1 hypothetical protein BFG57_06875 [Bacillus solimangrovi]